MIQSVLKKVIHVYSNNGKYSNTPKIVQERFDSVYYRLRNPDVDGSIDLISHYVNFGWREGRDPAEWFSVKDYLNLYPDVVAAKIDPFEHYLRHGIVEGRLAIPAQGSESRGAKDFSDSYDIYLKEFPRKFDAELYAMAAGLPTVNRWQCLSHFVEHGIFQPRLLSIVHLEKDLLVSIGDYYYNKDKSIALRCYQMAKIDSNPDCWLIHKIGDCYLNIGLKIDAKDAYLESIEIGGNFYWTFYNLGQIFFDFGDFDSAIIYFSLAIKSKPEKHNAKQRYRDAAVERFHVQWTQANGLSLAGDDHAASNLMSYAIDQYKSEICGSSNSMNPQKNMNIALKNIAIFGSDSIAQCKLYRIDQKKNQLLSLGISTEFYNISEYECMLKKILNYDAIILYRAPAIPEVIDVIQRAIDFGIKTFYDIDDLIFDDSCYPPSRDSLADMVLPAEYAGLVTGRVLFREAMAMCDYGIASTPPLQDAIAKIVRTHKCFLSRNALSDAHVKYLNAHKIGYQKQSSKLVLFYGSGSRSHNKNFSVLEKPLANAMRKNRNMELKIVGPLNLSKEFDGLHRQINRVPFTSDLSEYWRELSTADVNLAPLTPGTFNDGKSEIKWMEAAMFGIPSIVSSSAVYEALIHDGRDGYIARSEADWGLILGELAKDPKLRASVGANARERVLAEYSVKVGGENLIANLKKYVEKDGKNITKNKPLVLVVNIFYPPEYIGGATRVVEQTVSDILKDYGDKFSIEVFCGREPDGIPGSIDRYMWNDVPITSIFPYRDQDIIERSVETESFFKSYLDFIKPDMIHFHCIQRLGASIVDVAIKKGIPYVVSVHDGWWISDRQFLIDDAGIPVYQSNEWGDARRLTRLKTALNAGRATIAVSEAQAHLYKQRGIENVITIPNGSETLPDVLAPPEHAPVCLGLLGGLGLAKGADLLRQVLCRRAYNNLSFLIVDHSMLEGTVRYELWGENRVEIVGKTSFANVASIYSRLHGLLAISVCVESFGLVAREAQRLGRWVIASDRGGMAEDVVEGQNGFIINPADMTDLIKVFDEINANPARYRVSPPKGKELRSREDVAADIANLYQAVLENIIG